MKNKLLRAMLKFVVICVCGVFVGLAGGVSWGGPVCGFLSFITLAVALLAATGKSF